MDPPEVLALSPAAGPGCLWLWRCLGGVSRRFGCTNVTQILSQGKHPSVITVNEKSWKQSLGGCSLLFISKVCVEGAGSRRCWWLQSLWCGDGVRVCLHPGCRQQDALSSACISHLPPCCKLISKFRKRKKKKSLYG